MRIIDVAAKAIIMVGYGGIKDIGTAYGTLPYPLNDDDILALVCGKEIHFYTILDIESEYYGGQNFFRFLAEIRFYKSLKTPSE